MSKDRKIIESFNCAVEGIIECIKNEKHMRLHVYITVFALFSSLFLKLTKVELGMLAITISLVWIAEILNTAIEAVVDMYMEEYHDLAKLAKDAAAGAVFVAAMNSVIIGYLILYNHFEILSKTVIYRITNSPIHLSVISFVLVIILVVALKAHFREGRPFHGGMPSGHSAISFSILTATFFLTKDIYIYILMIFMSLLVSQTRVKSGIHSFGEVVVGAVLGSTITFLLFQLFLK